MRPQFLLTTTAAFAAGALFDRWVHPFQQPQKKSTLFQPENLQERLLHGRAIEAAIWGLPAVNADVQFQAMMRDAAGDYNQIVYWSRPSDWKNQMLTPNTDLLYIIPFINTQVAGPMVLEIPAATGGAIVGTITDIWQKALADVGPYGLDQGKGGRYLILPPGFKGDVPEGFIAIPSEVFHVSALLRSVPKGTSDRDAHEAVSFLKTIRLYPLAKADNPPDTRFIDASDIVFNATIPYNLHYFKTLDSIVQQEPWLPHDKAMIPVLKTIGIEKNRSFKPDARTGEILVAALLEAHAWLEERFFGDRAVYYQGSHWRDIVDPLAIATDFSFETKDDYAVDARGLTYFWAFSSAKHFGKEQLYLLTHEDQAGQLLDGSNFYCLTMPAGMPEHQYWSVTAYDAATHGLIQGTARSSRSSSPANLHPNDDGSIDIYFGPRVPEDKLSNWIPTRVGAAFEVIFRFYGPEQDVFDRSWQLPDLEQIWRKNIL